MSDRENISRNEVEAIIAASEKFATQLTLVTSALAQVAESQREISKRLESVPALSEALSEKVDEIKRSAEEIKGGMTFVKIVTSTCGFIVSLIGLKALYNVITGKG